MKLGKKHNYKHQGFSLIEVAAVIIIVGLLMIPMVQLYELYQKQQKIDLTRQNMQDVDSEVGSYFPINSYDMAHPNPTVPVTYPKTPRLPCPSDRGLAPNDPNYQKEFIAYQLGGCSLANLQSMKGLVYGPAPQCTPNGGFCLVQGRRIVPGGTILEPVLIGGVPVVSINQARTDANINEPSLQQSAFQANKIIDGWDNTLTYAVTLRLTSAGTYGPNRGAIGAIDEYDNVTAGINDDADYVLISHGPNHLGAFSPAGNLYSLCSGVSLDKENCDYNSQFRQALGIYSGNSANTFDDIAIFSRSSSGSIWNNVPDASGNSTNDIYNTNIDNVGVKTATPSAKLEVGQTLDSAGVILPGTVRADNNAKGSIICDKDGTNCFTIDSISGSAMNTCADQDAVSGNKSVMTGIKTTQVVSGSTVTYVTTAVCTPIAVSAPPNKTCPAGKYLRGIFITAGQIECCNSSGNACVTL